MPEPVTGSSDPGKSTEPVAASAGSEPAQAAMTVPADETRQPPVASQPAPTAPDQPPAPTERPVAAPDPASPADVAPAGAPAAEAAPLPPPPASAGGTGFSNDLEEQVFAPSAPPQGPQVGDVLDGHHLNEDLGRGWFIASPLQAGPSREVYVRPEPLWAGLQPHRALPRFSRVGALHVLEPTGGEPLTLPLEPETALSHLKELAQLLFALEKQDYAAIDLDPDGVRATPGGLRLRFPPRVARLGEAPEAALREGFTPPEVLAGDPAGAASGVYLLGALLYRWLSGHDLPAEGQTTGGTSLAVLGGVPVAGVPQLLRDMLAPADQRLTPSALLTRLRALDTPELPAYRVAAATTVGLNPDRPVNEDSYGFVWRQIGAHGQSQLVLRACVSDGMGGMAAGEVASSAAVQAFLNSSQDTLPGMVWDANAAVLSAMAGRDGGCTISGVELRGAALYLGHVGDTRAYLSSGGEARQLSRDHSYVAAMVASGQMTPEEAQESPERNKVLRSLGSLRVPQEGYVQTLDDAPELGVGDRVLLVSDGVWGEIVPDRLLGLLLSEPDIQALADQLVKLALDAGAPDNATSLVIERVK
ncbi:hypothetical protein CVO96_08300 [Deinococcus koreensis]|uniref:PPM-type phosphatase domain-containing protein n=2 Tax=Deinococcus koreensis TaxID=2054903 RepID=A0A2K3V2C6_9DEIO|nr:hypothetical protein CVO96_08300 [Deinococcus koreensis]